ncbi:MAG: hypothetical protein MRY32_04950 [Rickettsiales bacterium]|nr:hypothetical protein [Rickettsiales bacterium]
MSNQPVWCPICDEGWVNAAIIEPIDLHLYVCAECEACWPDAMAVNTAPFEQLSQTIGRLGYGIEQISLKWKEKA